jgi:hypothetical protein
LAGRCGIFLLRGCDWPDDAVCSEYVDGLLLPLLLPLLNNKGNNKPSTCLHGSVQHHNHQSIITIGTPSEHHQQHQNTINKRNNKLSTCVSGLQNSLRKQVCCGLFCITEPINPPKNTYEWEFDPIASYFCIAFCVAFGCSHLIDNEF